METVEQLVSFHHIQVQLSGGAPWGFTLKGGLEHGEPLIITKIEDGGKAAHCGKLKVGDELININGSALYGSRQEALILIKGSYRILKLTVRRRNVPLIRPHSWHLAKLSELPLPLPPPPPSPPPPCLPTADSPPLPLLPPPPPPPPPPAMQLHPGPYTLPWHTTDTSDLSMQWGQLSRPYSSTDRSSSLGSMESLDAPTPTAPQFSDSHNSPVDPALFNNKRDSAYSSFSASSNTSDYAAVPLRPGEACSMDNLLQGLGPACRGFPAGEAPDEARPAAHKSRSLTRPRPRPVEVKERPSSCCFEEERRGGDFEINGEGGEDRKPNPPQPPARKDSFRATRSRSNAANKRCASAPLEISSVSSLNADAEVHNGFSAPEEPDDAGERLVQRRAEDLGLITCDASADEDHDLQTASGPASDQARPAPSSAEDQAHPHAKHTSAGLHRHSAPEKLLATQLQLLQFDSSSPDPPPAQWSRSSGRPAGDDQEASRNRDPSNKWGGSRCSTPGSVFLDGEDADSGERPEGTGANGESGSPVQHHHPWGRSVSVPGDPSGSSAQARLSSDLETGFEPLSAAASVDTLLEDRGKKEAGAEGEAAAKKSGSSRNHRRNRRRSERFATNLRNEIQRKKAQLQRSRGPGGLLCSGETVQEEEGPDLQEEEPDQSSTKDPFASSVSPQDAPTAAPVQTPNGSGESVHDGPQPQSAGYTHASMSRSVQILDPGVPSFGVGIRVVEEPAPAGKARRWRWTPEHKLQPEPEPEPDRRCRVLGERVLGVTGSRHGVCAFTSSSSSSSPHSRSSSCSRMEESDILPFADRMKFFEETSKGKSGSSASSLSGHRQKRSPNRPERRGGELAPHPTQRRYSYQGGLQQDGPLLPNATEARRQSVSTSRERERERQERERQERERQERELEMERARLREREERVRQWEWEREKETERLRNERERELERQNQREEEEEDAPLGPRQEFYSAGETRRDFRHHDDFLAFWPGPPFPHSQNQNQAPRSAFHPVGNGSHHLENQQGYTSRSYTPTETYPARQQEATRLNRKYSLTERDYPSWRRESGPPECIAQHQPHPHPGRWGPRPVDGTMDRNGHAFAPPPAPLALRGRAMSENDLRFDGSHRWSPSISVATSQTLSEVEEGAGGVRGGEGASTGRQSRKKTPPPPRPPPPKWEQFHRRRASHHALFSSSPLSAAPPYSAHSSSHLPPPETSRQRSYSLPPERQEVTEGCPRCSCNQAQPREHAPSNQSPAQFQEQPFAVAPPSPMFSRRAFRPVAPPQREREGNPRSSYGSQQERMEVAASLPPPADMYVCHDPDRDRTAARPHRQQRSARPGAEWERAPSPSTHGQTAPPPDGGGGGGVLPPESYFAIDYQQQQLQLRVGGGFQDEEEQKIPEPGTESETTLSPSPAHSLEADLDVPMETDIDDFREEELPAEAEPITSELPCFALPVTVLETDIDTLPDPEASPPGGARADGAESGSPTEEPEGGDGGGERLSLEELFPPSSEGESGTESWRGAYQTQEHSTDSLDRRSGASSSCSSYYSTSTAKAQLLSQMKDLADSRDGDEDDELSYKKQLMESLRKKLGVLREAQRGLQEDIRANAQLGEEVENMVVSVCKPNEVDKFRMFIGDLDKVVSLILSLSGRLLRVETALDTLDPETEHHDRLPLLEKKRQLMRQLSEAQDLKDHVDRREQAVSRVLARCLSPDQHRDYSHFVKMKAALLVEQRQLEDKIRLGEEQLRGLRESLGLGLGMGLGMGMGMGMSMGYGHY